MQTNNPPTEAEYEVERIEAAALVDKIEDLMVGNSTRVLIFALGYLLGRVAAQSDNPLATVLKLASSAAELSNMAWLAEEKADAEQG
jgi:hypothetical protein